MKILRYQVWNKFIHVTLLFLVHICCDIQTHRQTHGTLLLLSRIGWQSKDFVELFLLVNKIDFFLVVVTHWRKKSVFTLRILGYQSIYYDVNTMLTKIEEFISGVCNTINWLKWNKAHTFFRLHRLNLHFL